MKNKRTRAADVANVTRAIAAVRSPEFMADAVPHDDDLPAAVSSDSSRENIRLGFLLHDVSRMRRSAYDQFMKPLGVTRAQWWVLAHLSRHDGMMQTQLADVLEVGKASLGDVVESLEHGGWVLRQPDLSDRRAKRVYLTKSAQSMIRRMALLENEFNGKVLGDLSPQERADLIRNLVKIKRAISRLTPEEQTAAASG